MGSAVISGCGDREVAREDPLPHSREGARGDQSLRLSSPPSTVV